MLPCIIYLFLNNQPDALTIPNLFCYNNLHVSGIFSAHHQEFSTVHSALLSFMQVSEDRFQATVRMELLCSLLRRVSNSVQINTASCPDRRDLLFYLEDGTVQLFK